jgi:hypothetical protein
MLKHIWCAHINRVRSVSLRATNGSKDVRLYMPLFQHAGCYESQAKLRPQKLRVPPIPTGAHQATACAGLWRTFHFHLLPKCHAAALLIPIRIRVRNDTCNARASLLANTHVYGVIVQTQIIDQIAGVCTGQLVCKAVHALF